MHTELHGYGVDPDQIKAAIERARRERSKALAGILRSIFIGSGGHDIETPRPAAQLRSPACLT